MRPSAQSLQLLLLSLGRVVVVSTEIVPVTCQPQKPCTSKTGRLVPERATQSHTEFVTAGTFADDLAAAQCQLEEEWEAELHAPAQTTPEEATVESSMQLLSMYVNRGNAAWASSRSWGAPTLWDKAKQEEWMGHEDWNLWKARMAHCLKAGGFAVQIHATGPGIFFPLTGHTYDVWSSDPWELLLANRPLPAKDRVAGVSMGIRILSNLVAAVEALGGKAGVARLTVVLHLTEEQFESQLDVLRRHNFAGLEPKNIMVFVQRKRHGYAYDDALRRFVQRSCGPMEGTGSGHSLMQLNWVGEACVLDKDGRPHRVPGTALEEMQARGVQWLVSQPAHDLGLLTRESALDLVLLPFLLCVHKAAGVSALTQVVREDGLGWAARTNGSIVMAPQRPGGPRNPLSSLPPGHPASGLAPVMELRALELHAGSMKDVVRAGKHAGSHYLLGLDRHVVHMNELTAALASPDITRPKLMLQGGGLHVKLDFSDLTCHDAIRTLAVRARQCPQMLLTAADLDELLPLIKAQDAEAHFRKFLGSCRITAEPRYPQSPSIRMNHAGAGQFRPTHTPPALTGHGGAGLYLMNTSPGSSGLASPLSPGQASLGSAGPSSVLNGASGPPSPMRTAGKSAAYGGMPGDHQAHNLVVFISSNNVSYLAVDAALAIAKPGRDVIHLVTVVSGYMHVEGGQALLDAHYANVARALVEARQEVLVLDKEDPQLLASMEQYVTASGADLVVMTTKALNATQLQASAILGSVTLAALKRLSVPVMVVNANSLNIQDRGLHHTVRAMALVHRHAAPLVQYMTERVLQPARGDSMVLCRVEDPSLGGVVRVNAAGTNAQGGKAAGLKLNHKEQQVLMLQRGLASMTQAATLSGLPPPLVVSLEEERVEDITRLINKEGVHIMGYLMPHNLGKVPEQLVHLIHSCRCAVLVFKHHGAHGQQQQQGHAWPHGAK